MLEELLFLRAAELFAEKNDKAHCDPAELAAAKSALDLAQKAFWKVVDEQAV